MNFDIAIIGGGPAGYTAAERAGANGLKAVLFEKKAIGGVCLNEGCIPTKTLLYSAKILDSIKNASKYGVFAESPSFDLSKIMSRKDKTVKMLTGGVKMTVNSYGVTIVEKEAFVEGEEKPIVTLMSLHKLEERLPAQQFMRVHRSYIVNLHKITEISRLRIIFNGNTYIPVGENYKERFTQYIEKLM